MQLLEALNNVSKKIPNSIILEDEINGSITYLQFEQYSGKLYNYLLSFSFPKERIVVIKLKRSYRIFIAIVGALKAAIPYVVVEETSPQEYIDIVYRECEPILTIDDEFFDKALKQEYIEGYKPRSNFDLAYIVYSTGSTGLFKGSMHEYGAFERLYSKTVEGYNTHKEAAEALKDMCFFYVSGFYSAASVEDLSSLIVYATKAVVISIEHGNDVDYLIKLAKEKKVYSMDASPLTLPEFVKHPLSCIKEYLTCYEMFPCKYSSDYKIYNSYGLSESCGALCFMEIDKDYDIAPIGTPCNGLVVKLLDKSDNLVKNKEIGELCFIPEYFRGYIKREDLYLKSYYNGYFHTGDLGYYDENNNIVIVGRKKDILDTNEGYIVPVFMSNIIKKEFKDISKCLIKVFKDENPTMIVMYYISDINHDIEEINKKVKEYLPSRYHITHIVKLDKFEYFYCGKLNRNLFVKPNK